MHPLILLGALCLLKGIQETVKDSEREVDYAWKENNRLHNRLAELEPEPDPDPPLRVVIVEQKEQS